MSWNYDDMGEFPSERAAVDWARRNNIDPRDLHIRQRGNSVDVGLRRSSGRREGGLNDTHGRRRDGFF